MGKQFQVRSLDEMARAARKLKGLSETYTEIGSQLLREAGAMGAGWDGADNQAFVEQINGFSADMKTMAGRLAAAGQTLEQQRANYLARQEANMTAVRRLTN